MNYPNFEHITKSMEELGLLFEAKSLLEQVYMEHGPYGDGKISDKLRYKINDFFGFNDSE